MTQECDRSNLKDMTSLLAGVNSAMYLCGMPDAAINALFDAHASVIDEIIKTPSVDYCEVKYKVAPQSSSLKIQTTDNGPPQIAAIGASIRRDMVRLDGRDVVIAALAA